LLYAFTIAINPITAIDDAHIGALVAGLMVPLVAALLVVDLAASPGLAAQTKPHLPQVTEGCLSLGKARGWSKADLESNRRARRFVRNCIRERQ
jgi:hypothetical protein